MDLYFEMNSGIAGDMTIGALLDLGASKEKLVAAIDSLGIDGYELVFSRAMKNNIDAYNFDVILASEKEKDALGETGDNNYHSHKSDNHDHIHTHGKEAETGGHRHDHDHPHRHVDENGEEYVHSHGHSHELDHQHSHEVNHDFNHSHDHGHSHSHGHGDHVHRHLADVIEIIDKAEITPRAKETALGIFDIIADAESKAHGISKEEVHFHEVGAVDSIIDIIGTAVLLDDLEVENVYFSDLSEGFGYQYSSHGQMPIPVPAVINILAGSDITIKLLDEPGEHVTPTGAAIVRYLDKGEKIDSFKVKKVGLGAGNKDFEKYTNILRVMEIEPGKKKH